jgi:hypothetical protein
MDDGHAEQGLVVGVVDQLGLAAIAATTQVVVGDEGVLQRCAGTFHLGPRTQEDADAALVGEFGHRPPGGLGLGRAVIDAAQAVVADLLGIHAGNGVVVELEAGGDDEEIVGVGLAALGDHLVAFRIELDDALLDQFDTTGHVLAGARDNIGLLLDAGGDKRETGLIEVFLARIDQNDLRTVQTSGQIGGCRQAGSPGAGDDDTRRRLDLRRRLRAARPEQQCAGAGGTEHQERTTIQAALAALVDYLGQCIFVHGVSPFPMNAAAPD